MSLSVLKISRSSTQHESSPRTSSTPSSGNQQSAYALTASHPSPDAILIFHVEVALLCTLGLIVLLRLPRAMARLWRISEWTSGYVLRYRILPGPSRRAVDVKNLREKRGWSFSDDSHTLQSHATVVSRIDIEGLPVRRNYPPHISSCPTFMQGALASLRTRISPGFSIAKALICVSWFAILLFTDLWHSTGPLTDRGRAGWVGISQVPFLYALAAKGSIIGWLLGIGYEKLNFLHQFLGRLVVIAFNLHGLGYIYEFLLQNRFQTTIAEPTIYWGFVGLICMDILFFFSTAWWRKNAYNFFLFTHVVSYLLLFWAALHHYPQPRPFMVAAGIIYVLDQIFKRIKTRFTTATIRPIPELGITHITCPNINSGWRAGQHVRLRVCSTEMGLLGWMEEHPFTIANAPNSKEGMVLLCKKSGDWTAKLYKLASKRRVLGFGDSGLGRDVRVTLEGPYGGPGHMMFSSYSAVIFFVGGSGITMALSAIEELIQMDLKGNCRAKVIELVWAVQTPEALTPLLPKFLSAIQQSVFTPVRVSVFWTRSSIRKHPLSDFFHPLLSVNAGRPDIVVMMEALIADVLTLRSGVKSVDSLKGLLVGVCGPSSLLDDVSQSVGKVDPLCRDQIGGIDLYEEVFGW